MIKISHALVIAIFFLKNVHFDLLISQCIHKAKKTKKESIKKVLFERKYCVKSSEYLKESLQRKIHSNFFSKLFTRFIFIIAEEIERTN